MSRINTNVGSLIAQRVLGQQNNTLSKSLERLSTGYRINRGGDDPAGLIISERLRSEKNALSSAIGNAERADQVVNVAEGGLQEINSLLLEVQSLVGQSANEAGLSTEEKQANQGQIDSILSTIDRIAQTTSFQGIKLLNGTFDYNVNGVDSSVSTYSVNAAKLESGDTRDVQVIVTESAQHGGVLLSAGAAGLNLTDATSTFSFEVAGANGAREFSFASGTTLTNIAASINTFTSVTGVSATVSGTGVVLKSQGFGSTEFVSVKITSDGGQTGGVYLLEDGDENTAQTSGTAYNAATSTIRDEGQDIGGKINGVAATGNGKTLSIASDFLDVSVSLTDTAASTPASINAFTVTGGGAKFNLGPAVNINNQVSLGIKNVVARSLGRTVDGSNTRFLSDLGAGKDLNVVNGDLGEAQKVINNAITEVSQLRGRLGAFQKNVVGATIRSLGVAYENTSAAESAIRDTDFAAETANLTRSQILVNAATNALAINNSRPQNVLGLLG